MRLHHSGTLTAEYFLSFAQLVIISREFSVEETQQFMEDFFFKGDPLVYGKSTRRQFLHAMAELQQENSISNKRWSFLVEV